MSTALRFGFFSRLEQRGRALRAANKLALWVYRARAEERAIGLVLPNCSEVAA
jgi:hypothetical protein